MNHTELLWYSQRIKMSILGPHKTNPGSLSSTLSLMRAELRVGRDWMSARCLYGPPIMRQVVYIYDWMVCDACDYRVTSVLTRILFTCCLHLQISHKHNIMPQHAKHYSPVSVAAADGKYQEKSATFCIQVFVSYMSCASPAIISVAQCYLPFICEMTSVTNPKLPRTWELIFVSAFMPRSIAHSSKTGISL